MVSFNLSRKSRPKPKSKKKTKPTPFRLCGPHRHCLVAMYLIERTAIARRWLNHIEKRSKLICSVRRDYAPVAPHKILSSGNYIANEEFDKDVGGFVEVSKGFLQHLCFISVENIDVYSNILYQCSHHLSLSLFPIYKIPLFFI